MSLWAGPGAGDVQLVRTPIEPEQVEYELKGFGGVTLRFHMRCDAIWQLAADDRISGAPL